VKPETPETGERLLRDTDQFIEVMQLKAVRVHLFGGLDAMA
jgi:hypothetical protein